MWQGLRIEAGFHSDAVPRNGAGSDFRKYSGTFGKKGTDQDIEQIPFQQQQKSAKHMRNLDVLVR